MATCPHAGDMDGDRCSGRLNLKSHLSVHLYDTRLLGRLRTAIFSMGFRCFTSRAEIDSFCCKWAATIGMEGWVHTMVLEAELQRSSGANTSNLLRRSECICIVASSRRLCGCAKPNGVEVGQCKKTQDPIASKVLGNSPLE